MDCNTLLKALADAVPQIMLPGSMEGTGAIVQSANGRHLLVKRDT
jgi:hypothetical protein